MENTKNNSNELPFPDLYRTNRSQIEHYESSINQRVIWLSIGQSFFFNVYALLLTVKDPSPELAAKLKMISLIFSCAALLTAVFTLFDVIATFYYLRKLRKNYEKATDDKNSDNSEKSESVFPPIFGAPRDRLFQHISPILIPLIFIATWTFLVCKG